MKYGSLILEKKEYVYLKHILNITGYQSDYEIQKCLAKLTEELKTAQIVNEEEMPYDIIRFYSKVSVVFENGLEKTVQIVIPRDKDMNKSKISIITPMGTALIGYSTGDIVTWGFPTGKQNLQITNVIQENAINRIEI